MQRLGGGRFVSCASLVRLYWSSEVSVRSDVQQQISNANDCVRTGPDMQRLTAH